MWDATTFSKNRDRLLDGELAGKFLAAVLSQHRVKLLLSSDHFSVDGTLLEAWASAKSFQPKDGSGGPPGPRRNNERDFRGERRRNDTHASTTDPDARLFRKGPGKEARLCFMGHALMENRNGLIVGAVTTRASGHAERLAALALIAPHADRPQPITLGADKGYDASGFVMELRQRPSLPMSRRTGAGAARPLTAAPPAIPAMASPSASASASRRPSAGPKRWLGCVNCGIAVCPRSIGNSPWRWPPMIWSACPNCSATRRHGLDGCTSPHPAPFPNPTFVQTNAPLTRQPPTQVLTATHREFNSAVFQQPARERSPSTPLRAPAEEFMTAPAVPRGRTAS